MAHRAPIVDSHLHLWNPKNINMKWLPTTPAINYPHLPATIDEEFKFPSKFSSDFVPPHVEAIVYVETDVPPAYSILETEWIVSEIAPKEPRIQGVVANAPVEDGDDVRTFLETIIRIGGGWKFGNSGEAGRRQLVKGVRRLFQTEGPEYCIQPSFVRGVQLVGELGLSFDLGLKWYHLENAVKLVSQCPGTQFVLDHIGKPSISTSDVNFEKWRDEISNLAKLPNVYCKFSGFATEALPNNRDWKPADLQRYANHILQAFGPSRVMFGSDWPVVKLGGIGYNDWLDIATQLTSHLSEEDKRAVWNLNARKFYRL